MRRNNKCRKSITKILSVVVVRIPHHAILETMPYVKRFVKTCMTTGQAEVVNDG